MTQDIKRKLRVLKHAVDTGNVAKTCRYFGIARQSFYTWKKAYAEREESGLINSKPCPKNPALRTPAYIEEKVLYLRRNYHLGSERITMFLERYHGIKISEFTAYRILRRHGINKLPQNAKKRTV